MWIIKIYSFYIDIFHSYINYTDTHASKKSLDPALDKKYSSSLYSKQMSLDESNTNDNIATSTKRYVK